MTIHAGHPFPTPEDAIRRLRGRLASGVTLWTAGDGPARSGLTVTSVMVAGGDPPRLLALLDPDADLAECFRRTGRAVCHLLDQGDQPLAETFAGLLPAPGGPWRTGSWEQGDWGPVLRRTRAEVSLEEQRTVGWSLEVTCTVDHVVIEDDRSPLVHRRGRYVRLGP